MSLSFTIPGTTKSTANLREHWAVKAKRVASSRKKAMLLCPHWRDGPLLMVTLTRVGQRQLDIDNLAASMKGHIDGIAARLRIDDGSPLVEWRFKQEPCEAGAECVRVDVVRVE